MDTTKEQDEIVDAFHLLRKTIDNLEKGLLSPGLAEYYRQFEPILPGMKAELEMLHKKVWVISDAISTDNDKVKYFDVVTKL